MAAIYLIRHGQASFDKDDYDQLSALGEQQAQILGKHWQQLPPFDKCYSGDLLRHNQTAEHFFIGLAQSQTQEITNISQSVITHSGFNEFNHVDVLSCFSSSNGQTGWQHFKAIKDEINSHNPLSKEQANKQFEKIFVQAMTRWVSGDFDHQYQESWSVFKGRCLQALQDLITQNNSEKNIKNKVKNIAVFTSGGPISLILGHILGLSDEKSLMLNKQLANSSVTKLLFNEQRLSIDYFNNYTHIDLAGKKWLSYR
jgi:broad specificity phosphatase PhoE